MDTQWLVYPLCAMLGYLIGSVNPAYFWSKARGFDLRERGSGNAGASNAAVTMGWKAAVIVGIIDILKATLAVLVARALLPGLPLLGAVAGVSSVLGHIFPFYLRFKGGKGFACYMGMVLAMDWRFFLLLVVMVALVTLLSDYIALATLTTVVAFPLYLIFQITSPWMVGIIAVCSAIMFFKHRNNIVRILSGEEIGLRKIGK